MVIELALIIILLLVFYFFNPFDKIDAIDKAFGGTKDVNWCPNESKKKCLKNCVQWNVLDKAQDYYCWKDYGDNWGTNEQIGQGDCTVGMGKSICEDKNLNRKYINNCTVWSEIDKNGNKWCYNDHGAGWVYSGDKQQTDCTVGFGRGVCKYDVNEAGKKYLNNCVAWGMIDNNANKWCYNDHGAGWVYSGDKEQAECTDGFGKAKCKYDSNEAGKKYLNNCVMWGEIDGNANKWCNNDHGAGWVYSGQKEQADCSAGFGKAKCKYDSNERNKTKVWNNCVMWDEIPGNGNNYCKSDFGNSYSYSGRNGHGCSHGWGKGECNSN